MAHQLTFPFMGHSPKRDGSGKRYLPVRVIPHREYAKYKLRSELGIKK